MEEESVVAEVKQLMERLGNKTSDIKTRLECLNSLVELSSKVKDISNIIPLAQFISCLRRLVAHRTKTLRTATFRVYRYYLRTSEYAEHLLYGQSVSYFIARSLEREEEVTAERVQALKLVRQVMEVDCSVMPKNIVQALTSIAEYHDDAMTRVALETLCEIAIRNPRVVASCGGMKTLFMAAVDPFHSEVQESLLASILYLLDEPASRAYIRPGSELLLLFAPLSDNYGPKEETDKPKRWEASKRAICTMLKSWTGLIAMKAEPLGLKSLVDTLALPHPELHDLVVDALFGIFRVAQPAEGTNPFKPRPSTANAMGEKDLSTEIDVGLDLPSRTFGERPNLVDNYLSALLISFVDCGLIEALIRLGRINDDSSDAISAKATVLLGELLHMSSNHLSSLQCARLQTLPSLVSRALSFSLHPRERYRASAMVVNLHQYSHIKGLSSFNDLHVALIVTGANKWRRLKGRDRRLDRIDDVKRKMDWAIDEKQLLSKLHQTQVLATKDHKVWAWDAVSEVLEGPLRNPAHLNTALRGTKFIKRILSFLRPSNHLFSMEPWNTQNVKYAMVGCQVLEVLLDSEPGATYLAENALLKQLSEMLREEAEGIAEKSSKPRLLNQQGILKTMTREYFTLLGTLSSAPRGIEMMKRFKIFHYLRLLAETQDRLDLSTLILTSLDYNTAGHSRTLLSKALASPSKVVRFLATRHLRVLLRAGVSDFAAWGVDFLVRQLSDVDGQVSNMALKVLDEACDEKECLESLITKKPSLLQMGKAGKDLWLRFLSTEIGFNYLSETDWITSELQHWKETDNVGYVETLEAVLDEAFSSSVSSTTKRVVDIPPHLYGELTKTVPGCRVFENFNHFPELVADITNPNRPSLHRRAALWAVGSIGSSETGLTFLERHNVVQDIVALAENSPSLSIRGTCFYVIAMIARTEKGRGMLDQLGWETPPSKSHICVPRNLRTCTLFEIPAYEFKGSIGHPGLQAMENVPLTAYPEGDPRQDILTWLGNLSNYITFEKASKQLKRTKIQHPEHFATPTLMLDMLTMLENYNYRLPVRRFIYSLLDVDKTMDDVALYEKLFEILPNKTPTGRNLAWVFPTMKK